jgi:predicted O-methyltransferase YrrM
MKLVISIPVLEGGIKADCHRSLANLYRVLNHIGIDYNEHIVEGCPCLSVARDTLTAMFLQDADATDQFFIDSDLGFNPDGFIHILARPEGIVGGTYPLKRDQLGYTAEVMTEDGVPLGRDGLIEAKFLPNGFLRIKRGVYKILAEKYPELRYDENVIEVQGSGVKEAYDFFGMGNFGTKFRTEDYAFCQRWRDIGGTLWLYPDVDFRHIGQKAYAGNYHNCLLHLPGGAATLYNLEKAESIEGWMKPSELIWLAEQAKNHVRILEMGSYCGRSTRALGDNTQGKVWAMDDWRGPRDEQYEWAEKYMLGEEKKAGLFDEFSANLKDLITAGKVTPLRMNHAEFNWNGNGAPDMAFIDGHHDYEAASRDIKNVLDILEPGGLISGHDYSYATVRKAVNELLPGAQVALNTDIWYATKEKNDLPTPVVQEV